MSYLPHTQADREHMLEVVGVPSVEDLFASIPPTLRLGRDLCLPEALTEHDLLEHLGQMASRNQEATRSSFLGAGAYRHFVPTLVETVTSLTSPICTPRNLTGEPTSRPLTDSLK